MVGEGRCRYDRASERRRRSAGENLEVPLAVDRTDRRCVVDLRPDVRGLPAGLDLLERRLGRFDKLNLLTLKHKHFREGPRRLGYSYPNLVPLNLIDPPFAVRRDHGFTGPQ